MERRPVGTTKGPGETPHEYLFVSADRDQRLKYGEFVYYDAAIGGERRQIMGRIVGRVPLRLYPDAFLGDPAIPPDGVASLLGYERRGSELFEISVQIMGYHHPVMGFVNPRIPPRPGTPIYVSGNDDLVDVLSRVRPLALGAVHVGSLLSRPAGEVPICLDARGFTSTHLAIIASTGSGKSYLAGVILEELMQPHNRAAVLVVDPHAEYDTLDMIAGHPDFCQQGYRPTVKIVRPNDIKIRVSSLTLDDLHYLLPTMTERMRHVLGQAYRRLRDDKGEKWTRADLMIAVRQGPEDDPVRDPDQEAKDPSVDALIWRLHSVLEGSPIFSDHSNLSLSELYRPGQLTVLQLNEVPGTQQRIVVATLLRRLNQARMETSRGRAGQGDDTYLPYPVFTLIEEAHNYAPAGVEVVTTGILRQILSEGRKFGISIGLISQRPGKLDSDVLSQCMTQCIMRIVNPVDQSRVAESIESVGRELLNELPALSRGQVIVAGASVNTPVLVRVRQRLTQHGAENPDAPAAWHRYFGEDELDQRRRDHAPPANTAVDSDPLFE